MTTRAGYVNQRGLALYLDLSVITVRSLVEKGELPPPIKLGGNQRWRLDDVDAWLAARTADPKAGPGAPSLAPEDASPPAPDSAAAFAEANAAALGRGTKPSGWK